MKSSDMPFQMHLKELRERLFKSICSIFICTVALYYFVNNLFALLTAPLIKYFPTAILVGTAPAEAFIQKLRVAFFAGLICAAPYVFYQLWLFIAPGLHEKERKHVFPFVIFSSFFFLSGALFFFKIVLPFALDFFASEFLSIHLVPNIKVDEYLSFITTLTLVFGAVFELPVITYFLARFKLISSKLLLEKWRYVIVGIFILAAILTPPDVVTQTLLALPLIALYLICISVTKYCEKGLK